MLRDGVEDGLPGLSVAKLGEEMVKHEDKIVAYSVGKNLELVTDKAELAVEEYLTEAKHNDIETHIYFFLTMGFIGEQSGTDQITDQ